MGGCSSKPKTAEFEGVLEVPEDKPQTEAPRKSLEAENVALKGIDREQDSSGRSIQTLLTEREQDDMRDMFAETDKQMIVGFSHKGNFQEERQVLEDDNQHVKQILAETIGNLEAAKGSPKEEILKLQINGQLIIADLHEDPVFNMVVTKTIQGKPLCSAIESETADTQQETLTLGKETVEDKEKDVSCEFQTLSLKDICISSVEDSAKLQVKSMGLHNELLELSRNISVGGKEIMELQKEPSFNVALGLQEDAYTEASGKRMMESEKSEAIFKDEEQGLDDSAGQKGQDNQFSERSRKCGELCKETEIGACEMVNAASGAVLARESGEDVLGESSQRRWEDGIEGFVCDEAAEKVITGTCVIKNSALAEASDQEPFRADNSTDANVSANSLQHVGVKQDLVHNKQEVNVDATFKVAMKSDLQAENHPINGFIVKESSVETLDTTHGDGESISPKSSVNDQHSLPVSAQLLLENEVQEEKPYAAEGQPKADDLCTLDEPTASQVIATTKKPDAQSVHVTEFAELSCIPAQNIPAPDIDEVLEKLASEFERQESLARAGS